MRTRNDSKHLEYMRQHSKALRAERAAAGLCVKCGGVRDAAGKICASCLERQRRYIATTQRVPIVVPAPITSHVLADDEAKWRWGYRGVAIQSGKGGQRRRMVGYFEDRTPDDTGAQPPYPWVKCGEGVTWVEAFNAADASE